MSLARVRALIVIGVLVVIALTTVVWAIIQDDQVKPAAQSDCPDHVKAATAIPPAKSVKLRIYNATDHTGLATNAKAALTLAGFTNITIGNKADAVEATAEVRYGPAGVGAAYLVRAHVKGSEGVPDDRKDASVDLILGEDYTRVQITPAGEIKGELGRLGKVEYDSEDGC